MSSALVSFSGTCSCLLSACLPHSLTPLHTFLPACLPSYLTVGLSDLLRKCLTTISSNVVSSHSAVLYLCMQVLVSHGCVSVALALTVCSGCHTVWVHMLKNSGHLLQTQQRCGLNFKWVFVSPVCVCVRAVSGCVSLLQRAAADVWSWPVNAAGSSKTKERKMK